MLLTDIGKDSLNSRETSCITMSSSYHDVKIANSVREGGFHKFSYLTGVFDNINAIFLYIFNQCTTIFYYGITINGKKDLLQISR